MKYLIFITVLVFFSSCAYHGGMITSTPNLQAGQKYEYVDMAFGYSTCMYFLGLGGIGKGALISQSKAKLYSSYDLQPGQSFENLTLNTKFTIVGPYSKFEVLAVADILQRDTSFVVSYNKNYIDMLGKPSLDKTYMFDENEVVKVLDEVSKKVFPARILKVGNRKSKIILLSGIDSFKVQKCANNNLFKLKPLQNFRIKNDIQLGDTVFYSKVYGNIQFVDIQGIIIGFNAKQVLVKTNLNILVVNQDDVKSTKTTTP
jgi:hypothetical protein